MSQELTVEILVNLLLGGLLIWIGYLIHDKKNYQFIAGYNIMTEEFRKRVDILKLSRNVKNIYFYSGILIALLPSTLKISGYYNWGIAFPVVIAAAFISYVVSFIFSIQWKLRREEHLR